ncbi:Angiogenin [Labeo rohita]|uniref:Angiogenin n=1 Tax=Labeo rohita TaxID=84645 RepID=A0ABQ8LXN9_LABRO|nr:Angiogenin [Labeo rohita]
MLSCVIILIVVLHTCLSELDLLHPSQPCTEAKDQNAYDTFLHQHLRKDTPNDPRKLREWQKFIDRINTWDRPIQSFLPFKEAGRVIAVCSSGGKVYRGNLCISKKLLTFFTVVINNRKQVKKVKVQTQHVILGCDKIKNKCLPIHFEANLNDAVPDNNKPDCSKAIANASVLSFEEVFYV